MIIALRKQIEIRDQNLNIINVNHWVIKDFIIRFDLQDNEKEEFAVITIFGYKNGQARRDGEEPLVKDIRRKIQNTYDENGDIVGRDYNKLIRYFSETDGARFKDFLKEAVLEFLSNDPDFADATDD